MLAFLNPFEIKLNIISFMYFIRFSMIKGISFDQLQTFADIIDLGSFSAAAEKAGVTQPAISLQLRQLERKLGLRLVERVGRTMLPTAAGSDFLVHVRKIQEEMSRALDVLAPHQSGAVGRIRIGTGGTACIYFLPPILGRMKADMPGLEIAVETGNTPDLVRMIEANELDAGLLTLPVNHRSLDVRPVIDDDLVAVFPAAEYPGADGATAAHLMQRSLIFYEGGATRRIVEHWFAEQGCAPKPIMELGSIEAIKRLVAAGLGWAIVPALSLTGSDPDLGHTRLEPPLTRSLGLVMRRDKRLTKGLRALVAAIIKQ